jgi:hypothetical protein
MVGFFFHLTYSARIAQNERREKEHQTKSERLALRTSIPEKNLFLSKYDAFNPIEARPLDRLEVNLFTYKW